LTTFENEGPIIDTVSPLSVQKMPAHVALAIAAALAWPAMRLSSQSLTVTAASGIVHVRAPGLRFIEGKPLARLKDGQSVRVDFQLSVLTKPAAAAAVEIKQTFVLSYDLWEERFAVTLTGVPPHSVSHLTSTAAEGWCVEQLAFPVSALGPLGRNLPFWIRLEYRVRNDVSAERDEGGLTLQGLIDVLSRRRKTGDESHSIEAGPFRLQE
jgi:hypothetical protein